MSIEKLLAHFFKPEVRKQGEEDFKKELVKVSSSSDTQVQAFIRASSAPKLTFSSSSIDNPSFYVQCSCSSGRKGSFCRHMWALLLTIEQKHPDFLESKKDIQATEREDTSKTSILKDRQKEFRKEAYEKVKLRQKALRQDLKEKKKEFAAQAKGLKSPGVSQKMNSVSSETKEALDYFQQNGFTFQVPVDEALLKQAKKELSRIFHPDRGGTHEESVELQRHYQTLSDLL